MRLVSFRLLKESNRRDRVVVAGLSLLVSVASQLSVAGQAWDFGEQLLHRLRRQDVKHNPRQFQFMNDMRPANIRLRPVAAE
jgi:hypothetical protein